MLGAPSRAPWPTAPIFPGKKWRAIPKTGVGVNPQFAKVAAEKAWGHQMKTNHAKAKRGYPVARLPGMEAKMRTVQFNEDWPRNERRRTLSGCVAAPKKFR